MEHPHTQILFLNKQDVDALLTPEDVSAAVEAVFRADGLGQVLAPIKELMPAGGHNALFAMPGSSGTPAWRG